MRFKNILLASFIVLGYLFFPVSAHAALDPYNEVCNDPANSGSVVCQDKNASDPSPIYGPNGVLPKAANLLAIIGGVIAVVIIMISGLKMITSSGDSKKLNDARNAIIYAAVGIVVIALARVIIEFIIRLVS